MAEPPQSPSTDLPDRRKSLSKYVKRLSSALRRGSSRNGDLPTASASASATTAAPVDNAPEPEAKPSAATEDKPVAITTSAGPSNVPGAYARSAIQQERARALFAKYGLTLEAHEWITAGPAVANVQRVEKPIRMRVRRNCHRCNAPFDADRTCTKCEHKRCKKCPRYPPKKPKDKGKEPVAPTGAVGAKDEEAPKKKKKHLLTMKTKAGGEVVYQPVRQRVRRTCHKCSTLFTPATATECEKCSHRRCTKCPREPAKTKKFPDGYPGDVPYEASDDEPPKNSKPPRTYRKPKMRVRWSCSECSKVFVEGSKICEGCSHERCDKCTRVPPKKEKKAVDPDLVKRVEERLKQLGLDNPPPEE